MKVILSGIEIPQYLSFRTLLAKVLGLIFAFAGGLSFFSSFLASFFDSEKMKSAFRVFHW